MGSHTILKRRFLKKFTFFRDKLDNLQHSYTELKSRHTQVIQEHKAELVQKEAEVQSLASAKDQALVEKEGVQATCDDFQREAESVLTDYEVCSQHLRIAQEDAARWKDEFQKVNTQVVQQKERNGMLEDTRKDLQEKLNHMDQQVRSGYRQGHLNRPRSGNCRTNS